MRRSPCSRLAGALTLVPLVCDCGNGDTGASPEAGPGGNDATTDAGATFDAGGQPDTAACSGDPSSCLFGTARATQGFAVQPTGFLARLYRAFPSGNANDSNLVAQQQVAKDSTWAFSDLLAWAHYYVEIDPGFPRTAGVTRTIATRIGPLVVPNLTGASVDVHAAPVQLDVFEESAPGASLQLQAAFAYLSESTPGSASVSILIGTTPTPMPYDATRSVYSLRLTAFPPAQPTYQITTSLAPAQPLSLVAEPPQFAGAITSPLPGATVSSTMGLTVEWLPQPAADYELVSLFRQMTNVYTSPQPRAADVSEECIPGAMDDAGLCVAGVDDAGQSQPLGTAGAYSVEVVFTKANCPPTADGCVHASTVAVEQLTVQ